MSNNIKKFRIYLPKIEKCVYSDVTTELSKEDIKKYLHLDELRTDSISCFFEAIKWLKESEFVIQQFIGIIDKNGKEVYEGDKVRFQVKDYDVILDETAVICYDHEIGAFTFGKHFTLLDRIVRESIEVVDRLDIS